MTENNKQIIIDVNKCKYRDTYTNFCKAEKDDIGECYTICTGNDCYYKQLKAKEQECEGLQKQVCSLRPELKSMINKICCKYNIEAKTYHKKIVEIINNLDKYGQALIKIKEIAEENIRIADLEGLNGVYRRGLAEQILQKSARL